MLHSCRFGLVIEFSVYARFYQKMLSVANDRCARYGFFCVCRYDKSNEKNNDIRAKSTEK